MDKSPNYSAMRERLAQLRDMILVEHDDSLRRDWTNEVRRLEKSLEAIDGRVIVWGETEYRVGSMAWHIRHDRVVALPIVGIHPTEQRFSTDASRLKNPIYLQSFAPDAGRKGYGLSPLDVYQGERVYPTKESATEVLIRQYDREIQNTKRILSVLKRKRTLLAGSIT
jgi:hypothetical protein